MTQEGSVAATPAMSVMPDTTVAPPAARITSTATIAPSAMLRSRPMTMWWRGQSRIRDVTRSTTPIAPEVVHSIATTARRSRTGEPDRALVMSCRTSPCTSSGR